MDEYCGANQSKPYYLNRKSFGDRECPDCEKMSLFEVSLNKWKCELCSKEFDEEWLDGDSEE